MQADLTSSLSSPPLPPTAAHRGSSIISVKGEGRRDGEGEDHEEEDITLNKQNITLNITLNKQRRRSLHWVRAWSFVVGLLGPSFIHNPRTGQLLLDMVKPAFSPTQMKEVRPVGVEGEESAPLNVRDSRVWMSIRA